MTTEIATGWKNRIVGHGDEAPDQLTASPNNFKIHPRKQQQILGSVLREIGMVGEVIVNKRTGYVVDGHMRVQMAISEGIESIPVTYVDLSEDEELVILTTYDPIAELAVYDAALLGNQAEESIDLFRELSGAGGIASAKALDVTSFLMDLANKYRPQDKPLGIPTEPGDREALGLDDEEAEADGAQVRARAVKLSFTPDAYQQFTQDCQALQLRWRLSEAEDVVLRAVRQAVRAKK